MKVNHLIVNINSEDPQLLIAFYRDVVGLPRHPDVNRESTYMAGSTEIVFDSHSELTAASPQPQRILLNFFVDDVAAEEARIEDAGVEFASRVASSGAV